MAQDFKIDDNGKDRAGKLIALDGDVDVVKTWKDNTDITRFVIPEADFNNKAAANRDKFAGSGFVEFGKHYSNTDSYPNINGGAWTWPAAGHENEILLGDNLSPVGSSKSNHPIVNVNGFVQAITNVNEDDQDRSRIKFPPAPLATDLVTNGKFDGAGQPELVTNGIFDAGTTGWSIITNATLSVASGKLRVTNTATTTGEASQVVPTVIGNVYRIQVGVGTPSGAQQDLRLGSAAGLGDYYSLRPETGADIVFTATSTQLHIRLLSFNSGGAAGTYAEWDNISVKELGFDTANSPTVTITDGVLKVVSTGGYGIVGQEVSTVIGKEYKVEGLVKNESGVQSYLQAGDTIGSGSYAYDVNTEDIWKKLTFTFTAVATTTWIGVASYSAAGNTGYFDNISLIDLGKVERQDLVFLESWHEKIADKNIVYPHGNVQSLLATDPATSLTCVNGTFTGFGTYSLFGNWQASSALIGKGIVWSTMTDSNKKKFISDPENNVYLAEDGELVQVRYRIRVVEGSNIASQVIDPQGTSTLIMRNGQYAQPWGTANTGVDTGAATGGRYFCAVGNNESAYTKGKTSDKNGYWSAPNTTEVSYAYKGLCFAVPIALVSRRNQGAWHPTFNPNGSRTFTRSDGGSGSSTGRIPWPNSGSFTATQALSTVDCFDFVAGDYTTVAHYQSGNISSNIAGNPDNKYYDAIYESDVLDLRNSAHKVTDLKRTLEREFNKLVAGETRGWENGRSVDTIATKTWHSDSLFDFGIGYATYVRTTDTEVTGLDGDVVVGRNKEALIQGVSGQYYKAYVITSSSRRSYSLLPQYGDVTADFAAGTVGVIELESSLIPYKTTLQCDIIGDPANYYRGAYDFTSDQGVQTLVTGDVVRVVAGFLGAGSAGVAGNFYKLLSAGATFDISATDYSGVGWQDLGPDREDSWHINGIAGTPLLVGEEGEDYLDAGTYPTISTIKLSRKATGASFDLAVRSPDQGNTWLVVSTDGINNTTNMPTSGGSTSSYIYLLFYETESSPFELADNAEVLGLGGAWASNFAPENYGGRIARDLIGKIPTNSVGNPFAMTKNVEGYFINPALGNKFQVVAQAAPTHNNISLYAGVVSPAAKVLPYLTRENGKLLLQALFKEMVYDSAKNQASEMNGAVGGSSETYVAGEYYYITSSGTYPQMVLKCIVGWTGTLDIQLFLNHKTGEFVNSSGTVYMTTWDFNGWGDDSKFNVVDNVSTTTDDNGNTALIGQKRIKPIFGGHFIGDDE